MDFSSIKPGFRFAVCVRDKYLSIAPFTSKLSQTQSRAVEMVVVDFGPGFTLKVTFRNSEDRVDYDCNRIELPFAMGRIDTETFVMSADYMKRYRHSAIWNVPQAPSSEPSSTTTRAVPAPSIDNRVLLV